VAELGEVVKQAGQAQQQMFDRWMGFWNVRH
jgi:hypothetical protein